MLIIEEEVAVNVNTPQELRIAEDLLKKGGLNNAW